MIRQLSIACIKLFSLLFIFLSPLRSFSQEVKGRVIDENGEGLSFATLYIQGTTNGTTTNIDGVYSLKLSPGQYQLVFQFVGYKTLIRPINIADLTLELNVQMEPDVLRLKEVVITAGEKDPAYRVIRNAINKRKFHLNEIKSYDCNVYIKGLQRLDKVPNKVLGFKITIDTGIVYLSESVSELSYMRPDKIKERVISSKVSGNNRAFSYNQASQMMVTFYKNILFVEGLSERGFVSPIANNALLFYRYKLEGTMQEGENLINKIRVIPIRKSDPVFSGYIYIIEDSWGIHSVDFLLTRENQIEFVDSLKINQVNAPVESGPWMMFSQRFSFQFRVLGFEGSGYFVGVHSDYQVEPNYPKKYFNNQVINVEEGSNKRDSIYWKEIRPIPLTRIEQTDYRIKDSLQVIKESKPYRDSIDHLRNKITISNVLFGGYTHRKSFYRTSWDFEPILSIIQFNTVEGLVPDLKITYAKNPLDRRRLVIAPQMRYGFSNEKFNAQLGVSYRYNPLLHAWAEIKGGRYVQQYNANEPIKPSINTYETLFEQDNLMKIYEKSFISYRHRIEFVNGLHLTAAVEYAQRRQLENTSDFTFFDRKEKVYTSNLPVNATLLDTSFPTNEAFILDVKLRIRFAQKYYSRPHRKVNLGSKYPTFAIRYRKGIKAFLGSDVDFDQISLTVNDDIRMGLVGTGGFLVSTGTFLNDDTLTFVDFQHFNGNLSVFANYELGNFQLLDYYFYSTTDYYLNAHYEHHFNGFIFNKLPLLRKLKLQAVAGINYLYTEESKNYWELGFGIEHIFKVARVDIFTSFQDGSHLDTGFRLGFGF